jgi:methionyl-tRNA formyltransferase
VIVLAADYVGFKVVEFLCGRRDPVDCVGLDPEDRGGFNAQIEKAARIRWPAAEILSPADLERSDRLDRLAASSPRLGILAWWPRLLKGRILSIPSGGWLNLHPSYLPHNRGKNPNFWCLVDGTPCGVSLHYADPGVDRGDVLAQEQIEVSWEDTGETIYLKSRDLMVDLFVRRFDDVLTGRLPRQPQREGAGSVHRSGQMEEASCIDLDGSFTARELFNIIRARMFPPHPTAFFYDRDRKYSVTIVIKRAGDGATR